MAKEQLNFSDFGQAFQKKLGHIIFEDSIFADEILEVLEDSFFNIIPVQQFVRLTRDYKVQYGTYPTYEIMDSVISNSDIFDDTTKQQTREYFLEIQNKNSITDIEYVKNNSLDFCKRQALKGALVEVIKNIQKGTYEDSSKIIEQALTLGSGRDLGVDFIDQFELRYQLNPRLPISTGQQVLDNLIGNGLAKKEFGLVIGGSGLGKSMVMVNFAASAIQEGFNVVYYTLELQHSTVGRRFDSCISGIPLKDLNRNKEFVYEAIKQKVNGKLIVKEYPPKALTINMLTNHLDKTIRTKFKPDMIIIDYADIMGFPTGKNGQRYEALGDLYTELKSISSRYNIAVWTVSQVNRSGYTADLVSLDHVGDAFSKIFIADLAISIQRTVAQKSRNEMTFFLAKNRNGPDGIILRGTENLASAYISIDAQKSEDEHHQDQKDNSKDIERRIIDKFIGQRGLK